MACHIIFATSWTREPLLVRGAGAPRLGLRRTGGSYLSASDTRVLFGLRDVPAGPLQAEVRWPNGRREIFAAEPAGAYLRIIEGTGEPAP